MRLSGNIRFCHDYASFSPGVTALDACAPCLYVSANMAVQVNLRKSPGILVPGVLAFEMIEYPIEILINQTLDRPL